MEQCFGGIDVSQDRLDVLLLPQATGFSVANDQAGWNALIARLRDLPVVAIKLEPERRLRARRHPGFAHRQGTIRPASRGAASILIGFGSSPVPAARWPRMIGSMRA